MAKPLTSSLPPMDTSFEIQVAGRETKINWIGKFKYKRPSLGARGRIEVMHRRLNGDQESLDREVDEFHAMVAHLRHTLVEWPTWWQESNFGLDLYDGNVVSEVHDRCMTFEASWKEKVFGGDTKGVGDVDGDQAASALTAAP